MLKKISLREKLLLGILGITAFLLILQKVIVLPALTDYRAAKLQLEQRNKEIVYMEELLAQQKNEEQRAREAEDRLSSLKELLPHREDTSAILVQLGMEAVKSGVKIVFFKPMAETDRKYFLELPARVKISGLFPEVLDYLVKLDENTILSNLSEIRDLKIHNKYRLTEVNQEGYNNQPGSVEAEFVLLVYSPAGSGEKAEAMPKEAAGWSLGRQNAFVFPGAVSPNPGIPGISLPPPVTGEIGDLTPGELLPEEPGAVNLHQLLPAASSSPP